MDMQELEKQVQKLRKKGNNLRQEIIKIKRRMKSSSREEELKKEVAKFHEEMANIKQEFKCSPVEKDLDR